MKVKWGVIGAGGIARRRTIPEGIAKAKNARLVAVMDVDAKAIGEVAEEFRVKAAYTDVDALLADPEVEAVYIATPAHLHKEQFQQCVRAGKHVLVEKPLAHTMADARTMARSAAAAKVKCAEGYMMKFHPLHQKAREMVLGGQVGKPVCVRGQLSCWFPPIKGAWRQDSSKGGGGSLVDMASHVYDLFQYILDSPVVEVTAMTGTLVHKYPVEDSATTLLRFANGCQGMVDAFFNIPDEVCPRVMEIYGSEGAIMSEGTIGQGGGTMKACSLGKVGGYDAQQARGGAQGFKEIKPGKYNMYRGEVEALSEAILQDKPVEMNSVSEGLQIMKIMDAAYKSAKTGRTVKL